jgi:hypothetical protein
MAKGWISIVRPYYAAGKADRSILVIFMTDIDLCRFGITVNAPAAVDFV